MGTPQIIWIVLMSMSLAISLVKHGEPRGNFNFWSSCIALAIEFWIVWAGGFFG